MRAGTTVCWLICISGFLWLALDGQMHWDEPAYLYAGGYLDYQQIMEGDFQPSGIKHFSLTRPLHILMIHLVTQVTGVGLPGLVGVVLYCTLSLVAFLFVISRILRVLLAGLERIGPAMALGLLIPVVPYLAFKTLPETGALLWAGVAMWALIKGSRATTAGATLGWMVLASVSVALTLVIKAPMLLLVGSGVPAIVLFGGREAHRFKLLGYTLLAAGVGCGLAYLGVIAGGIDPSIYGTGVSRVGAETEPLSARILNNGTPPGLMLIFLPLALLSRRKREAGLFLTWYLLAVVPLAVMFPSMEARYQSPQLPALIGLIALALDGLAPRLKSMWDRRRGVAVMGVIVLALVVMASHKLAIAVMQHEVRIGQIHRTLMQLDERYGKEGYALISAWTYSDFLYLRFVYPDRPVYTSHIVESMSNDNLIDDLMRSSHEDFFPGRMIETPEQLRRLGDKTPVLFGFHYNFAAENLRAIFNRIPGKPLEAELAKMHLADHLATSWLWDNPEYLLEEVAGVGHYRAFEITSIEPDGGGSGDGF